MGEKNNKKKSKIMKKLQKVEKWNFSLRGLINTMIL